MNKKPPPIIFAVSEIKDGPMTITGQDHFHDIETIANRKQFLFSIGIKPSQVVFSHLTGGSEVRIVDSESAGLKIASYDGLITKEPNVFLSVVAADCFPVAFYNSKKQVIGLAHCGWRGIAGGIIENMLFNMTTHFDVPRYTGEDFKVIIGPGIGPCHFYVDSDVANLFINDYPDCVENISTPDWEKYKIDLKKVIIQKLVKNFNITNITDTYPSCTFCAKDQYFSHRREKSYPIKTQMAVLGMKK